MANNAYADKAENSTDWYDIGTPWKKNASFGWESDGLRGYVFANTDNSLLVVSIKGTSAGLWGGGPTGEKDKLNDNTLFSCCCGRISRAWTPVCDCFHENEYQCNLQCLYDNISHNELYYTLAMEIYEAVQDEYKNATIWLTGHSLGGALASLVSQTLYVPTVTFEIPGDQLASRRLHLPYANVDHSRTPLWHFGHTADPIFVGACTGPSSSCWYGGFAMETRCHTGKVCTWDTVNEKNWSLDIRAHRVQDVIEKILKDEKEFPSLPDCVPEVKECVDCGLWEFVDPRDNKTTGPSVTPTATKSVPDPPEDPWMTL
ncbi:Alpha/Beta hydrolase protein [Syncephalastrum racemosum]|uniref:triacylglycerol lipase n=1 Tax=Syncephalastrum racemosum TaxID=13706 RepID=A0A1X2HAM0_SYNRA|nr:Alpha/Beta hydrolase protein [Syncephalastrum racemosum]